MGLIGGLEDMERGIFLILQRPEVRFLGLSIPFTK
jgi:hypothetical protein